MPDACTQGLEPWDSVDLHRDGWALTATSVPGVHGPGPVGRILPPVMGTVLELRSGPDLVLRLHVSGDTLFRPWLREVVERTGPLDAAVVHLGGTRIAGVLVTMDDQQGADLVDLLDPRVVVPVHHDDYRVFRSPLRDFVAEGGRRGFGSRIRTVARGETVPLRP